MKYFNIKNKILEKVFFSLLFLVVQVVIGQNIVDGIVTDDKDNPLIGAFVSVKGGDKSVVTDIEGKFSIPVQIGAFLKCSYLGFENKNVRVNSNIVRIKLKERKELLDEVVVTGYQKIKSRVFTGSSISVKMEDIKLDGLTDISRMLEGRVAGLNIQNVSGTFGAAPRINIRGGASILGNVQPLWVIDGAVYEDLVSLSLDELVSGDAVTLISSAISGLNSSDIKDIQVLKDASATSMYGARALNGVIVITTKSGRRNSPTKISYSYEQSFRSVPSYSNFDLLNSQETMSVYQELERKGYLGVSEALYGRRSGAFYQFYKGVSTINPKTGKYYIENTPEAKRNFLKEREYVNTDWFKHVFEAFNPVTNHTISFSGGGENTGNYASLGFYKDCGWTVADNVSRFTANLKNTYYLGDKLKTTFSVQGNLRNQKAPGTFIQRKNTAIGVFERDFDINPFSYALSTSRTLRLKDKEGNLEYYRNNWASFNILNEYKNNYMDISLLDFKAQVDVNYNINDNLKADMLFSTRRVFTSNSHFIKENSNVVQAFRANKSPEEIAENIYLLKDKDNPLLQPKVILKYGGIFNKNETTLKSSIGRVALAYNKQIGEHDIKGFTFTELRYADRTTNPFKGFGIQYDKGNQVFTDPLVFEKLTNSGSGYFSLSNKYDRGVTFSGNTTYGYAGKYIFNSVINYEGSNASGKNSVAKWLPTWNVGVKWNVDKEYFMEDFEDVSSLAFRVSYGLTAKMNEKAINSNTVFKNKITNRFNFGDRENALSIVHLENRDLTWEKMYEFNLGLDVGLFNNRIKATIDTYQRNSFDLIDLVRTSGVGGQYYKYVNFGDMRTRGLELSVNSKNITTKDFKWRTGLSTSYMNQKITRLVNSPNTFEMVSGRGRGNIVGFPKGSLFSFNYQGPNSYGLPTFDFGLYPLNNSIHKTVSGADFSDTQYSKSYLIYHGSTIPNITGGVSNTFNYKNWELSFFISMQAGNKIRLNPSYDPSFADLNVFTTEYYNRWLKPYDELSTDVPTLPSKDLINLVGKENIEKAYNTYNYSQNRVVDGSFLRMKNISFGYNFPKQYIDKIKVKRFNLRGQITNPFLLYSDARLKGQDPEYYRSGGVSMPTPKQFTLTLNIGF